MSLTSQNLQEIAASRCYDTWAIEMGVTVAWDHLDERARRAWREVLKYNEEATSCSDCGSDLSCPICVPDIDSEYCHDCGAELVCPDCEGFEKKAEEPAK